jgi:cell division protein FtsN
MRDIYEFSFERGQLMKVLGGLGSLVLLVFFAGLLTGLMVQSQQPVPTFIAETPKPQPVALPAPPPPVVEEQPVAEEDQPAVESSDSDGNGGNAAIDPDRPAVEDKPAVTVAASNDSDDPVRSSLAGKFAVQLGAFLQANNAGVLAKRLEKRGFEVDIVPRLDSHGRTWYLVRYGIFENRAEATAVAMELKARENLDALVRPSNSM